MIGRVEVSEILGMAGICAALLFAGFSVETLGSATFPAGILAAEISAPEVPGLLSLPDDIRLERPVLVRPIHPAPPDFALLDLRKLEARSPLHRCADAIE